MPIDNNTLNYLNLKESEVEEVSTVTSADTIFFNVTLIRKDHKCPNCGNITNKVKDYKIKKIKHSIFNDGRISYIAYKQRRYICLTCNKSFIEDNPFVSNKNKISKLVTINVLKELTSASATYESVANRLNISTTTVLNIFDSNINYKRGTLPEILSIDEFHCSNNPLNKYACVLLDFKENKIVDIIKSRRKDYLANYLTKIPKEEREKVKHVSIDMWPTYKEISEIYFPNAIISVDSFHVIQDINRYLNKYRINLMKKYDEKSKEYYLLKTFGWLLTIKYKKINYNDPKYNRKLKRYVNLLQLLELILQLDSTLNSLYSWKELYLNFNSAAEYEKAQETMDGLITSLEQINSYIFKPVLNTLITWKKEIINSFIIYENIGRVSNGKIEGRNSIIKTIKKISNGINNFDRYRNRIIYVVNSKKQD